MTSKTHTYITTTLPYVNGDPHVGFALEIIRADVIARYKKLIGREVFFNTGTDEHGIKIHRKAIEEGITSQSYVDRMVEPFKALIKTLHIGTGLYEVHFTRTTDAQHKTSAEAFWRLCADRGYIYKKHYTTKYCSGCELEKTESELVDDACPIHPNTKIDLIDEENYFFKMSAFGGTLKQYYDAHTHLVIPEFRYNEIKAFVERGLEDFSISRLKTKMPWGISVPGDDDHVMYVWFDALVNYISVLGWPEDGQKLFAKFWVDKETSEVIQICGKDNLRQQSAMWQSMLLAAGLPGSDIIIINGFLTGAGGIKMSKSLGNTINPRDVVEQYGAEALRYFVIRELSPFEDSPFTMERFAESYNSGLVNTLGNLVSRFMKLVETYDIHSGVEDTQTVESFWSSGQNISGDLGQGFAEYNVQKAFGHVWERIQKFNEAMEREKPFTLLKAEKGSEEHNKGLNFMTRYVGELYTIAVLLAPFLPETSAKIIRTVESGKMPAEPLFPRK